MGGRRFAQLAALALFIMFVAANLIANTWLRSWRLDLTESQLYSLSAGTKRTLDELTEPVELKFFFSRDAAAAFPIVQTYGVRVREMLQAFVARSRGRVRFVEVNVKAFSNEEDAAVEAGIEPRQIAEGADPLYFGLTGANAIDDRRAIPFFDPAREPFLEYEVTRLIYELENPNRTRVGLITSLPLDPAMAAGGPSFGAGPPSLFAADMGRLMQVERLAPDFSEIADDYDVLAIVHPAPLSPAQTYAIDQYILRHGRAFIALDPAAMTADSAGGGANPFAPAPVGALSASSLEPLLARWGVAMTREVVLDRDGALPVNVQDADGQNRTAPQPLFFRVPAEQRDDEDLMTAWLSRDINFGMAGGLTWSQRDGIEVRPLARTSGRTMRIPAARALMRPTPFELLRAWPNGGGRIETIALRLSGHVETAFPEGPPDGAPPAPEGAARLARSAAPVELVIVADVDFLADDFYVDPQSGAPAADNGAFALNAIDLLSGSDALVSLRSRAPATRRMELVEKMEREAQARIERRQEELQARLQETEASLAELQARGRGSGFFSGDLGAELTEAERAAVEDFRARVIEVRGDLRSVARALRGDIDRLETLIVFINVWLAPLLIACAGLVLFWRRQVRARKGARR